MHENLILPPPKRRPWTKGKLIGAKPPLLARHVVVHSDQRCTTRARYLEVGSRGRALALP